MKRSLLLISVLPVIFISLKLSAQINMPIQWNFAVEIIDERSVDIIVSAQIDEGWRLFAANADAKNSVPFEMLIEQSDNYTVAGKMMQLLYPVSEIDDKNQTTLLVFRNQATFKQRVILNSTQKMTLSLTIFGQCCNPTLKQCAPVMQEEIFYINYTN